MKCRYLQEKISLTLRDFKKTFWLLYGIHELHFGINVYEKSSLVSIFK